MSRRVRPPHGFLDLPQTSLSPCNEAVEPAGGGLKDDASESLELIRQERRDNQEQLDRTIKTIAQFAFQKGLSTITEVREPI